jgi:hypothetical protein
MNPKSQTNNAPHLANDPYCKIIYYVRYEFEFSFNKTLPALSNNAGDKFQS